MKKLDPEQRRRWKQRTVEVLGFIEGERERQLEKWGVKGHNSEIWLAIITEEVGELAQAVLNSKFDHNLTPAEAKSKMIHEARQVAASAAALVQCLAHGEA